MSTLEIKTQKMLFLFTIASSILALSVIECFYESIYGKIACILILVCSGMMNIVYIYKKCRVIVSPLTIFSVIWMILLPLTSFSFPLMDEMSKFQWEMCIGGIVFFSIGGILSTIFSQRFYKDKSSIVADWVMSPGLYQLCIFLILISIFLYLLQALIRGGFPAFFDNVDYARRNFYLPGLAFLSNIGFLPLFLIFCDNNYRTKNLFVFLTFIFLGIQMLMAVRFLFFLAIIMMFSTYSINRNNKKQLKSMLKLAAVCAVCFIVVVMMRGGAEDKQVYFIDTGVYSGTAAELENTEIVRYFGMSQRMMESYINYYPPGCSVMGHTLFPLLDFFGVHPYIPEHYGINGYTACNIITYFYFDAGWFWWLLMVAWSAIMNIWYFAYKHSPNSIFNKYLWGLVAVSVTMSFYCYVNSYQYWCFHFIILLFLLKNYNIRFRIRK